MYEQVAERDYERDAKREEILKVCFKCMVENGIEQTSIRYFSDATGMSASNLYYWFKDKDEIVKGAAQWGLNSHVNDLFNYAFEHTGNLDELCEGLVELLQIKKFDFRLIFQIATSPRYGEYMRELAKNLPQVYEKYTETLAERMNVDAIDLFPYVNLFISCIVDNLIWERWECLAMEMKCILYSFEKIYGLGKSKDISKLDTEHEKRGVSFSKAENNLKNKLKQLENDVFNSN